MIDRLAEARRRYDELTAELASPDGVPDSRRLASLGREMAQLEQSARLHDELADAQARVNEARDLVKSSDPELAELARDELVEVQAEIVDIRSRAVDVLVSDDPDDARNAIVEVRAGTGGEEAALFAGDLLRMYTRYAERLRLKAEPLTVSGTDRGGVKEGILRVVGARAFGAFRFESGVHRVQRVPVTEAGGRIHTSAASVAVLPEAEAIDIEIPESDIRVDVFRSSGHGGQSVNTTDSAVRLTHLPTNTVGQHPGREVAVAKPGEGLAGATRAFAGRRAGTSGGRARPGSAGSDWQRRSQREDPDLQLPAGSGDRPPGGCHRAQLAVSA